MDEAEALQRLCERHGVATGYHDVVGHWHRVAPEALAALLRDAGFLPADVDPTAAEAAAERRSWLRALPPVRSVAAASDHFSVTLHLPASATRIEWQVDDESGACHQGAVDAAALEVEAQAEIGGAGYRRLRLSIALALPVGYHRLRIDGQAGDTLLVCAPARCHQPAWLERGGRLWGFTLQLHSLRSERNWGFGDFGDLADFVVGAARAGADVVGLNPLHALFAHNPAHQSPYSPSSRGQLNPLYIDVEAVPDFRASPAAQRRVRSPAFQARLAGLRAAPLIDHEGVSTAKHEVLELLYRRFLERAADDAEVAALALFRQRGGVALQQHALFEALQAHLHAADAAVWGWPAWPEAYRDPGNAAVAAFAAEHAERIDYHAYLQWQAARQLEAAAARCAELGMAVGLYLDLAVSVDRGGSDAWRHRHSFALDVRVGAPPDAFNTQGQDWGLPPLRPDRLREGRHAVFIEALRANMRGAGAIRIDHVMMLMRLFWIPAAGTPRDGSYVAYPVDELMAILALESQRHRCLVIGEDLGTVPDAMRDAMRSRGVQSYRLLYFEREADGAFRAPASWPREAVVAVSTHDLPTLAGWWSAHDLRLRFELGLIPDAAAYEQQVEQRKRDRTSLLDAVRQQQALPQDSVAAAVAGTLDADAVAAVHAFLAAAPSCVMMAQLEDALGEVEQANLPGTTFQHPNWQRKYGSGPKDLWARTPVLRLCAAIARSRPREAASPPTGTRVPRATYRLQLHSGFTFDDAARIVPYLARLGISHVYCSPIHRARPGSMHGYDVVAHDEINPELGGLAAFERLTKTLKAHGMGQLIDLVPNHMGVLGNDNAWWSDVLAHGMASRYARHFDIDWRPLTPKLAGKVMLPVLGDAYGRVLERGELSLLWDAESGEFGIGYFEHRFPLAPESTATVLERACAHLGAGEASAPLAGIATALRHLPGMHRTKPKAVAERARDSQLLKAQLALLAAARPAVAQAIAAVVEALNGPQQRDALHRLLEAQAWRLAHWRAAADEINYRRFFDVNELAALRNERRSVFEATHAMALDLAARGWVDGLRIDHPDGLQDPARYFERLQDGFVARAGLPPRGVDADGRPDRPLYVVAEKIAAPNEEVPESWAVHGTTGYRFANLANAVLVDERAADRLKRIWRHFTGQCAPFEEIVYQAKREVAGVTLASDLEVLSIALLAIGKAHRSTRDHTLNTLREVLATVAASLTVYRTYNDKQVSEQDRHFIDQAVAAARERLGLPDPSVFEFVREALLGRAPTPGRAARRKALRFARRFQQFSAPVAAKGVEDTAFYRYFPLASANEVGGEPARLGVSVAAFHEASGDRQRRWPQTMLATSTHDNKRAEDVRLRIDVLSEMPGLWRLALRRWSRFNAPLRGPVLAVHEYLLYQTLLGTMPVAPPDAGAQDGYADRIVRYMHKAAREGKTGTSWTRPDAAYEEALERFVRGVLAPRPDNAFLADLGRVVGTLDRFGALNGISLTLLKYSSPGVPDLYQGCELIDRSLVDPDNRRPVDYGEREHLLETMQALAAAASGGALAQAVSGFAATPSDGRAKLWLTWRLLALRQRWPALFRHGSYEPLEVRGERADHVIAFARRHDDRALVVIVARLFARLGDTGWGDTCVQLPAGFATVAMDDEVTGLRHPAGGPQLALAAVLQAFPGAVLTLVQPL
ncbi:malto-oligosyltrehalose synthase [Variovorax ginsengisoli]|uniref:4-alpha-glucanotransferase n=1 Tax=Variovorax ginsengisoli TaxID=363844 RepID=A0ABT8S218_9BURK|nr:malto-oligosyltrehalose synthase [Variovorax ginsengisoli]MDN8613585.1 malto-oligosyltrehalose synthase [Variovorax ginsengisoli]MDO1532755.1 malto-oligosyltrehalose synthase [Variovorax ginsengisoli]